MSLRFIISALSLFVCFNGLPVFAVEENQGLIEDEFRERISHVVAETRASLQGESPERRTQRIQEIV